MSDQEWLAAQFEANRAHLRAVAYRMLGSLPEAEDAVQEGWLRLSRSDTSAVDNLGGWLTTVVSRVCLDMLRSRKTRREDSLDAKAGELAERADGVDPQHEAQLADSVGLALLVVLEMLTPAERLAFVLHDLFAMPFEEIADVIDKSPAATRQLASRARRRVQGNPVVPEQDLVQRRRVVDAFLAAARGGDFEGLVAVLDPDVVLRADGRVPKIIRGAREVASQAALYSKRAGFSRSALVNGSAGFVVAPGGRLMSVFAFTFTDDGRISEIDVITDPVRLADLDLGVLG